MKANESGDAGLAEPVHLALAQTLRTGQHPHDRLGQKSVPPRSQIKRYDGVNLNSPPRSVLSTLLADFQIIFERDPAARNVLEVLFCYPGFQVLLFHRVAHWLYTLGLPFCPRLISQLARSLTGIEIHPGAQIGKGVFIDHGMGVVIGETAIVGDYCLIYQGVTLGGTGKETGKRHPTLGENVVVGAGAKVLGNLHIGNDVRIGAGSVVLRDVPADCTVVGVPGRIIYRSGVRVNPLEHGKLPDSEATVIRALVDRIEQLEQQLTALQQQQVSTQSLVEAQLREQLQARSLVAISSDCCALRDRDIRTFLDGSGL